VSRKNTALRPYHEIQESGLNNSAFFRASLGVAVDLAHHFKAELYLVNVIPFFPTTTFPDFVPEESFLQEAMAHAERHLAKCHAALAARGIKASTTVEVGNDIAGNIMEVIEREHIEMVVISTHGISGWHPLVFGSIAEKVVKLVQCLASAIGQARDRHEDCL
jgi:nucleotide-binding universal stress UspA family protein